MRLHALAAAVVAASCASSPPPDPAASPSASGAAPPADSSSPAASAAPGASAPLPNLPGPSAGGIKGLIVAADSCKGFGGAMAASKALKPNGTKLLQAFSTGCGCLKGAAHYTVAYEPKTSPLRVHLCAGPGEDHCRALCAGTLEWDLATALGDAGAKSFELVD